MKIQFTKNELQAARKLSIVVAREMGDREAVERMCGVELDNELSGLPFVTIEEDGGVTVDIPEDLFVDYYNLAEGYVPQVVNLVKMVYGLLKQFKFITKNFESQLVALVKHHFTKTPETTEE